MRRKLRIGQKLWWYDYDKQIEGFVYVVALYKKRFAVIYNGREVLRPYSVLDDKLFFVSHECRLRRAARSKAASSPPPKFVSSRPLLLSEVQAPPIVPHCNNCFYSASGGDCAGVELEPCELYRPRANISKEEMESWPVFDFDKYVDSSNPVDHPDFDGHPVKKR